jgi:cytochrome c551/c552
MNITPSAIYWISVLDNVAACAAILAFGSAIASTILLCMACVAFDADMRQGANKSLKNCLCVFAMSAATSVFTPSAKTCAAMYVIPAIANSEKLQGVTDGIYDLAAEWIKELKPAKSNGEKGEGK